MLLTHHAAYQDTLLTTIKMNKRDFVCGFYYVEKEKTKKQPYFLLTEFESVVDGFQPVL